MRKYLDNFLFITLVLQIAPAFTQSSFEQKATYQVCFVPNGASCQSLIVSAILRAQREIRVQAYSFTSAPIAKALLDAKSRGVDVEVILDKSQKSERCTILATLHNANIPVEIDYHPAIAHNKVMVFDEVSVFTGSFNFTKAAQEKNAENGIIINDTALAKMYLKNWNQRWNESRP